MGAIGLFRHGKASRMRVGTNSYVKGKSWQAAESAQKADTTNFECFTTSVGSSGLTGGRSFSQGLIGFETLTGSFDGGFDARANPFEAVPGLYLRDDGPSMALIINRTDNQFYYFDTTIITSSTLRSGVDGIVTINFAWENQGYYVRPVGNF